MIKIFSFAVVLFALVSPTVRALELPDLIDRVRPSVVGVGTHAPLGAPQNQLRGTGFVVGDGLTVITNHHVIDLGNEGEQNATLVVFVGRGKRPEIRRVLASKSDRFHDLARLTIEGPAVTAAPIGSADGVREGQAVALIGFPIGAVLGLYPSTNAGIVSAISPIAIPQGSTQSLTADQIRRLREPFEVFQLDAIAYPGNSGSPVFDVASGKVIGVVNSVLARESKEGLLKDPSRITYAIPSRHVLQLLEDR